MTKSLLAVLAHPDDESFGLGGTLALYGRKGYDTYYLCATGGEEGTVSPEHLDGYKDIAELRAAELRRAAKSLGLTDVFFLGYRDSGMQGTDGNKNPDAQINHSVDEVAGRVVGFIRRLKPDVIITHDPIGGYKHPDHIHIHKATLLAFEHANDAAFHPESGAPFQPRALYYQVFSRGFLRWLVRLLPLFGQDPKKFGRNKDVNLAELAEVNFPIHVRVNIRSVANIKREAGAQHVSQGGGLGGGLLGMVARIFGQNEEFMRAYPPMSAEKFVRASELFDL